MSTTTTPPVGPTRSTDRSLQQLAADRLAAHSITALRVSIGLIFLVFGVLKFFPGASPAEPLVVRTIDTLTLGIVSGTPAVVATAVIETFIGITLVTGIGLRAGLLALGGALVGIMAPLVLFAGDLFPGFVPTLEGQYVLKDIIIVAAGATVAAKVLGARYVGPSEPRWPGAGATEPAELPRARPDGSPLDAAIRKP